MVSLKAYELIEDELKSIYRSRLQTQILLSLNTGNKTLLQLREITGSSTSICKIVTNRINESVLTFGVITKFENFWKNHHLKGIRDPLLNEIGDLYNSQLMMDTSEDFFSFDDKTIDWGRKFFQYYKERSIAPEIRDI